MPGHSFRLSDFGDVLTNEPGRMTITEHNIDTGDANPYRLPHAYRDTVCRDLQDMEESGIIEPSTSEWAAAIEKIAHYVFVLITRN